ncbi:TVP38/TMEM64 family protein [soil metagenome]
MLIGVAGLLGLMLAIPAVGQSLGDILSLVSSGDGAKIRTAVQGYGPLAPAVSIFLILLHMVIPFPAELMALANGLAFGFWAGLVISWTGFMLSAIVMYGAGNWWGRPLLDRLVPARRQERLDSWLLREGVFPLLAVRLVPLVPFNTVCLVAGVIRAPFWTYAWTTGVGILPLGILLTLFGSQFGESTLRLGFAFWLPSLGLLALMLMTWWILRRRMIQVS